jgi:hypothetical protein
MRAPVLSDYRLGYFHTLCGCRQQPGNSDSCGRVNAAISKPHIWRWKEGAGESLLISSIFFIYYSLFAFCAWV